MMLVVHELEILERVIEDRGRTADEIELRQRERYARELLVPLLQVVGVQMAVPAGPYEVTDVEIALLGEHVREQRIRGDVEGHAQEDVGAALVELTTQAAV